MGQIFTYVVAVQFAGWLLDNNQIDILKIKLNPLLLGKGVRIFGDSRSDFKLELIETDKSTMGFR